MKKIYCVFLLTIVAQLAYSQTGKIVGRIISTNTGRTLGGATILLIEKSISKAADQNGVFDFSKMEPGTYSINCSYAGYQSKIIEEIIVKPNENTEINISLDLKTDDAVVVTAKRIKAAGETVASLLIAQKNSASVSDGITDQSIKKTPDRSSSDVIKRVSGASIQDDKFAVIRGLNDRYNASFINGAPLPSTESDRKAFAFDIFPSAILDNLIIYKTATADKTGEFGGGIIEIATKSSSTKRIGSITIGQGYNSLITGKNRLYSEMKGATDWLGLDDGSRALPTGLPAERNDLNNLSNEEKLDLAKGFEKYQWGVKRSNTRPNFNFQLVKSLNINRKDEEFISSIFSMTYNNSFTFTTGERNSFDGPGTYIGNPTDPGYFPTQRRKVIDSVYNDEVIWATLGNISIKINSRNNISWKNNFSVNTDYRLARRVGNYDFNDEPNQIVKETFRAFTSNKIYTSQLAGEHQIGKIKTKINWLGAYSVVNREIPNQMISSDGSLPNAGAAINGSNGSMVSTNSEENIKNAKIDITQPYTFFKNAQNILKIGGGYQFRNRDFTSRALGLVRYGGSAYEVDESVYDLPEDQRFLGQYLGLMATGKAGVSIQDATVPNSQYFATSSNTHLYIMNDQRFFKKLRAIYGVRMENFNQKLLAPQRGFGAIDLNYRKVDFLPSANLVYALTPKTNIRVSYSETVNRPEFRELASFGFYEYITGLFVFGNPTNTRAKINNYDFRYEIYPGKAQLLSVSSFYKKFTNPIEFATLPININEASYFNNPSATVFGVEAEFRVLLSTLFADKRENSFLNRFTFSGNGAYIKSKVPIGKNADSSEISRPLQGQSPYLINFSLGYSDESSGLSSTFSLNRIGERLAIAGSKDRPDFYEKERTVIDFQLAKTFNSKVEFKFNIRDLLAQKFVVYLDMDKSTSFTEQDRIFSSNNTPRVISFTGTFKF